MIQARPRSPIGVLLSGGLDSSILFWQLLRQGERVQPIYIESGLAWQIAERRAVEALLAECASPLALGLVRLQLPLADLYDAHWSITGRGVPGLDTPDEAVYLPGRNPLLIIKARLWCQLHGVARLALGCLRTNPFADATSEFFANFEAVMDQAASGRVDLVCPLGDLDKRGAMLLGRRDPLHLTFSCLAPVEDRHCGRCNKCAERAAAFALAELPDPTRYACRRPQPDAVASGRESGGTREGGRHV